MFCSKQSIHFPILTCLISVLITGMTSICASAQPQSIGITSSFRGFSISYDHKLKNNDSFLEMSIMADTEEFFLFRSDHPGVSASVNWNIIFKQWLTSEGNTMSLYAGPGATIGYGKDFKTEDGLHFGLQGRLGIKCDYNKKISISACITPIIGSHMTFDDRYVSMKYFRNGIQYALVPEIGIKYRF